MAQQTEVGRLIKQLSTLSYAVHLKRFYLPANAFLTTVESEKDLSLIHQSIEQLIDPLLARKPRLALAGLNDVLMPIPSEIGGGYAAYFDYLNAQVQRVQQAYHAAVTVAQAEQELALVGILLAQSRRIARMQMTLSEQQTAYVAGLNKPSTLPNRPNEPFDTEAILSEL
ncbi:MAG: hypothetical protein LKJ69_08420 [Lactobacillus sp.]|nr:hypothetical protein [Lactobacillus sp.]MCI2033415.1 hypothetical protein [Lactobacillus sp.]